MARSNFSWGAAGVGKEGVDYGNTNNWTEQQWQDYESKYGAQPQMAAQPGLQPAAPAAAPNSAPTPYSTAPDMQKQVTDSYMTRAQQGTEINPQDPNIRQQVDPYAAAQERQRRQYETSQAERLSTQGLGSSGAMDLERRRAMETAGQNTGAFESQLIGRELESRRNEISDALKSLGGMVESDQGRQLQRELAAIDAAIKREGIAAGVSTSDKELGLKDKLGMAGINVDLLRAMLQNQQFDKGQSLDWSRFDWDTNPMNPGNWRF